MYREYLTIWQGASDDFAAVLCDDLSDMLAELGGDDMRPAEADAWDEAARHDEAVSAMNQVEI